MEQKEKMCEAIPCKSPSRMRWTNCLEFLTLLYIGVEILCQEFRMCYFTSHFPPLTQRLPLIEAYMLRSGLVLMATNILFQTGWRNSRRVFFLYGICLLDALTSFMAAGGVELAWKQQLKRELITIVLFYCAAQSVSRDLSGRMLHIFYWGWLLFWSMMCCLSLCQFALMLGKDGTRITDLLLLQGSGYNGRRLFGVFDTPEYAAVTSLLLMLAGGYCFASTRSIVERSLLALCNTPLLFFLVLSGSRNAQAALYLCLFLAAGLACFKRTSASRSRSRRACLAIAAAIAVAAGAHLGYMTIQRTAEHIPGLFSDYSGPLAQAVPVQDPLTDEDQKTTGIAGEEKVRYLERIDTKGNIGTNRFSIWKDYLSLWTEYGLFGLSSTYDSRYIQTHHPELFICEYIREHDPAAYATGYVYHPHNGCLKTLVSTGYLGFAFLMLFLLGCVKDTWKAIRKAETVRPTLLFPLLIAAAGFSSTMFDLELFFVFNPVSYIFWLALGILMKRAGEGRGRNTDSINEC